MRISFFICFITMFLASHILADQNRIQNYATARDDYIYPRLYADGGKTFYCRIPFRDNSGLQVEHIFPASWMKKAAGCAGNSRRQCQKISDRFNYMEADLHNLHPAIGEVNQDRSNYLFGIIGADDNIKSYQHPKIPGGCDFEYDKVKRIVEPPKIVRGDVARAVFYIMDEYGAEVDREMLKLLLKWNKDDKPSENEKWRNDRIEELQGNRNKFIDNYQLADEVF